jgi:translation initiation factor 2 subunit 3
MNNYDKILSEAMQNQPILNVGMIGHVSNGKSSTTEKITGIKTQKYSSERERNITIKLGYANAKIFRCNTCDRPECFKSSSSATKSMTCDCGRVMELVMHFSAVDCFDPSTKVLTYDGSTKMVSELTKKDLLVGPDGKSRKILKFCEGEKEMHEIKYVSNSKHSVEENKFVCTGGHLLVLRIDTPVESPFKNSNGTFSVVVITSENNNIETKYNSFKTMEKAKEFYDELDKSPVIFETTVATYLNFNKLIKKKTRLFHAPVMEFTDYDQTKIINLKTNDATEEDMGWLIGYWLANGTAIGPYFTICSEDDEILKRLTYISNKLKLETLVYKYEHRKAYKITLSTTSGKKLGNIEKSNENKINPFTLLLKKLNLLNNKHISKELMFQKSSVRKAFLAGFIDGDGYYGSGQFEIMQSIEHKPLTDGLLWIARSLGFTCHYSDKMQTFKNSEGEKEQLKLYKLNLNGMASELPISLTRKKGNDVERAWISSQPFMVNSLGMGKYKGFEVNGDGRFLLSDFIVAHNCPGHNLLTETMMNGTCVMDTSILVESVKNPIPAPQTVEHLKALQLGGIPNSIVCVNKLDLVKQEVATEYIERFEEYLETTIAKNSPIVPMSATFGYNIDVLLDYISQIKVPKRAIDESVKMIIIRSFNVNHPGTKINELKGGVIGGTIVRGMLKVGDEIEIRPGYIEKIGDDKKNWKYKPLKSKVLSIHSEKNKLDYAISGGLIGVQLEIDPALTSEDGLVGNVLTSQTEPNDVYEDIAIEYELLDKTFELKKKMELNINVNASNCKCVLTKIIGKEGVILLKLEDRPISINNGDKVTLSYKKDSQVNIIGYGKIIDGNKCEQLTI